MAFQENKKKHILPKLIEDRFGLHKVDSRLLQEPTYETDTYFTRRTTPISFS